MSDTDYIIVMLAKMLDVLDRKGTHQDGNWGYPPFHEEIAEMRNEIFKHEAVKRARMINPLTGT